MEAIGTGLAGLGRVQTKLAFYSMLLIGSIVLAASLAWVINPPGNPDDPDSRPPRFFGYIGIVFAALLIGTGYFVMKITQENKTLAMIQGADTIYETLF